ncbi:MAG: branched-chain amino acid ABC transporter permease [Thermodesulfobacteriota bacterium]
MDSIVYGIVSGSIILLGAIGFSMTLKAENFINIAHGQMLLLGAYTALLFNRLGMDMIPAAGLAVITTGIIGVLINRFLYRPIKAKGILVLLFSSIGTAYIISGLVGAVAGQRLLAYDLPPVRAINISGVYLLTKYELLIIIIALGSVLGLHLFLTRTALGKAIRAVADNYDLARIRGFNTRRTADWVWFIASALAGLAGILLGVIGSLHTEMGWDQIIIILAATVLGGLGSIYGVMLAAILLGLGMEVGILFFPSHYRSAIAFAIIIIVLLIKPEGLQSIWARTQKKVG